MITPPQMWFISIESLEEKDSFDDFIKGRLKQFTTTMEFQEWLAAYNSFPLHIYLNGVMYHFAERSELSFFQMGFEARHNLELESWRG